VEGALTVNENVYDSPPLTFLPKLMQVTPHFEFKFGPVEHKDTVLGVHCHVEMFFNVTRTVAVLPGSIFPGAEYEISDADCALVVMRKNEIIANLSKFQEILQCKADSNFEVSRIIASLYFAAGVIV
jgi:hypothetical protein